MAGMLELPCQEFKIMINMLIRALMEKVDNMEEQMNNISRYMKILRKTHKEMLEIKNNSKEMKDASDGLIPDWTQLKKESLNLKTQKQKWPN